LGSSRLNFLLKESLIASQKIGEREIERKSGRGGESRRRKAGGDLFVTTCVLKRRINFLFYGFLSKGLGAEILAPED
jgi:hypothetical protein